MTAHREPVVGDTSEAAVTFTSEAELDFDPLKVFSFSATDRLLGQTKKRPPLLILVVV